MSNTRMAILMDTSLCMACYACRVACQNHNSLPAVQKYLTLDIQERGVYPTVESHLAAKKCMHCGDAPCVAACPVNVLHVNEKGFINYVGDTDDGCIGCGLCVNRCPYDVPKMRNEKMYKCTGCESLITDNQEPACVDSCIANALHYGSMEDMIAKGNARVQQIRGKYPNANLYGVTQQDGLGLLMVLRINPGEFGLT